MIKSGGSKKQTIEDIQIHISSTHIFLLSDDFDMIHPAEHKGGICLT